MAFRYRFELALTDARAVSLVARRRFAGAADGARAAAAALAASVRAGPSHSIDREAWQRACTSRADAATIVLREAERHAAAAHRRVDALERHRARQRAAFELAEHRHDEADLDETNARRSREGPA